MWNPAGNRQAKKHLEAKFGGWRQGRRATIGKSWIRGPKLEEGDLQLCSVGK